MTNVLFSSWNADNKDFLESLKLQTPKKSGIWKTIQGVAEKEKADIIVFFETKNFETNKKSILLKKEPSYNKTYNQKAVKFSYPYAHIPGGVWWLEKEFDELLNLPYMEKTKLLSVISSGQSKFKGHRRRVKILKRFFKKHEDLADLYGRGIDSHIKTPSYKGVVGDTGSNMTKPSSKFSVFKDYHYSLVIENGREKNYWTEKIADCLLSWSMPIYLGCPNILDYFPEKSIHILNPRRNINKQIINLISNTPTKENIIAIKEAREKILNDYNIWEIVYKLINDKKYV